MLKSEAPVDVGAGDHLFIQGDRLIHHPVHRKIPRYPERSLPHPRTQLRIVNQDFQRRRNLLHSSYWER